MPGWEGPFFVTYTHQMEEPRNLELTTKNVTGKPGNGNRFLGTAAEFEYGVTGRWTTELYFDGQATSRENAVFTGYRWENRFQLIPREHWINPVLCLEFEDIDGADKALLETVGHDGADDLAAPTAEMRPERKRELEAKLILGSYYKGWTIARPGGWNTQRESSSRQPAGPLCTHKSGKHLTFGGRVNPLGGWRSGAQSR